MNHLSTEFAPRPDLKYPFEKGWHPEPGEPFEVANGVFWLYMPMPISLDHINLWLLRDGDGWVIVDSGLDTPECKLVWDKVFDTFVKPEQINKIIITHYHPDHIGLAAWLAHRCDCKINITRGEFSRYHNIRSRCKGTIKEDHDKQVLAFVRELGLGERCESIYGQFFSVDDKPIETRVLEDMCEFIKHDDLITVGEHTWQVVMGNGHSPEHACLYCADLEVMIAGDQALPRISSNISVYVINRHENPLSDWLDSCARLRDDIPNDTLIFPAHQEPFYGLDLRMQQLIDDHHAQLNRLRLKMVENTTIDQARKVLFLRELSDFEEVLATGETLAHINYLIDSSEIKATLADNQSLLYQKS